MSGKRAEAEWARLAAPRTEVLDSIEAFFWFDLRAGTCLCVVLFASWDCSVLLERFSDHPSIHPPLYASFTSTHDMASGMVLLFFCAQI